MLEKNEPDRLTRGAPPEKFLIEQIGKTLVGLAGVPASKQDQFLTEVSRALERWSRDVIFRPKTGKADRFLYQMLGNAEALHEQLSAIFDARQHLVDSGFFYIGKDDVLLNVGGRLEDALGETLLTETKEKLAILIDAIGRAGAGRTLPKGALPGIDGYPGLDALVFGLERAAHRAGGKFTAHRRNGGKGTLIKALDEIKNHHLGIKNAEPMVECLPSPDKHPVATYEKLLRRARSR